MKKIKLIATGGTISGRGFDRMDLKDYESGHYTPADFIEQIPEIRLLADVQVEQLTNFSSTSITPVHWIALRQKVEHALNEADYDGVVITHGTNTLEETAYFLHLTVNSEKPVVCVGAQRPFTALSTDAAMNLVNAIRVAIDPSSHGKGVLVVMNDEINCAREVTKTNTYRLEAFQSGQMGFLGYVDPDHTVQFYRSPLRKHTVNSRFSSHSFDALPHVAIVYSYAGTDGDLIRYIANGGKYAGIVVAGTGAGRCSGGEKEALGEAIEQGLVVVRSSRVGSGRVVPIHHYKGLKSVTADNLLPQKARILLMLSLSLFNDVADIQPIFNDY